MNSYHTYKLVIGIMFLCVALGCSSDKSVLEVAQVVHARDSRNPMVSFLLNTKDVESANYNNHIRKAVNYSKIPYRQLRLEEFNISPIIPSSTKVLALKNAKGISRNAMDSIVSFVARGNTIVFTNMSEDSNFGFLSGVKRNAPYMVDTKAHSYIFKEELIPGFKNQAYDNDIAHYGLKSENFLPTIQTIATAVNNLNFPSILRHRIGKGQVISINTSQYAQKQDRGIYFAAILNGLEFVPYPVANVSAIFLDDFPSPLYSSVLEPIKSELNIAQSEFYLNYWWPDMIKTVAR
jgi:hypothetical protein